MNERGRACVNGENAGRPKRQRRRYRAVGKFGRRRTPRRPTGGRPDKQTYTNAYAIVFGGGGGGGGMNGTRERDRPSVRANEKQSYTYIRGLRVSGAAARYDYVSIPNALGARARHAGPRFSPFRFESDWWQSPARFLVGNSFAVAIVVVHPRDGVSDDCVYKSIHASRYTVFANICPLYIYI